MIENKKKKKIKLRLKELYKIICKHNILYHKYDKPEISDYKYDKYIDENNKLEKKYPHLILAEAPNKKIGSPALNKFQKINHKTKRLSLGNCFNKSDLIDFLKRVKKFLN